MSDDASGSAPESTGLLDPRDQVRLPAATAPMLMVVVDTEEEFDWSRPHDRGQTAVSAMRHIHRAQEVFDAFGARPCYVIDYPVASQPVGFEPLREIAADGRCVIGAHLHPWVNPPHDEAVNRHNSFPGNLPAALEEAKLRTLNDAIATAFGAPATIYKAGRYGIGPHTAAILTRLGFDIDLSPAPAFDFSAEGGPNFSAFPNHVYRAGPDGAVTCIPCTGAFVGLLGDSGEPWYRLATRTLAHRLRAPGILARLRLVERIRLSPEGFTAAELRRITRYLVARGVRVLTLSFHSPSVEPGLTPYVRNPGELRQFLDDIRAYLDFFTSELGGRLCTPDEVKQELPGHPR